MGTTGGEQWDTVIVGAGQAGCAAAYDLVLRGMRVLLVERADFPRVKPCAGGVTIKALNALRFSIAPVVRCVVRDMALSTDGGTVQHIAGPAPMLVTTVRSELDAFCLDRAVERGAVFSNRGTDRIVAVDQSPSQAVLRFASGASETARFVIAADGANSTIRRLTGLKKVQRAFALEGHMPMPGANRRQLAFDFGAVQGGYGWIFPKGDHLNIGLYTQDEDVNLSRDALHSYARTATGSGLLDGVVGHPLGIDGHGAASSVGRVLFAGDAAGTCERLLGEGIHNAIKSGQAAAAAILSAHGCPRRAASVLRQEQAPVARDVAACARGAQTFYGSAAARRTALAFKPVTSAFRSGFAAGMTFRDIAATAALYSFYAVNPVRSITEHEQARAV